MKLLPARRVVGDCCVAWDFVHHTAEAYHYTVINSPNYLQVRPDAREPLPFLTVGTFAEWENLFGSARDFYRGSWRKGAVMDESAIG